MLNALSALSEGASIIKTILRSSKLSELIKIDSSSTVILPPDKFIILGAPSS